MTQRRIRLLRFIGFALVTFAFAVTQPILLIGLPLAILLMTFGPRSGGAAVVLGAVVAMAVLGARSDLWWFERGWPLLLGGAFVWIMRWRSRWNFSAQALAALGIAAGMVALITALTPRVWLELDASMSARSAQAAQAVASLLGRSADDTMQTLMRRVATLQAAVFPALVGVSSLGALGLAVSVRNWLTGGQYPTIGSLKGFRFNDHLIWIWLIGLILLLAPAGEIASRVGGNAVFFMGALYVLRGLAVVLTLAEGMSLLAGVFGGLVALLVFPLFAVLLAGTLALGVGDTWLNVRERVRARRAGD